MEVKDWITTIIPIVCNGLIVFSFQLYISHRIKAIDKKSEMILSVIDALSKMVCEEYNYLSNLIRTCSPGHLPPELMQPAPFEALWNVVAQQAVQICDYANLHSIILEEKNISIDEFAKSYTEIAARLGNLVGKKLSTSDKREIFNGLKTFECSIILLNSNIEYKAMKL